MASLALHTLGELDKYFPIPEFPVEIEEQWPETITRMTTIAQQSAQSVQKTSSEMN